MKFLFRTKWIIACLVILFLGSGCAAMFLQKGYPTYDGTVLQLSIKREVEIIRDRFGIPHIYANNEHDTLFAQGYVHAQDRLWQMEMNRRLADGRLSEIAGPDLVDVDYFIRILGIDKLRCGLAESLDSKSLSLVKSYVKGVNAYIKQAGKELPLEFQTTRIVPDRWKVEDVFAVVALNGFFLETNLRQEILSIVARKNIDAAGWAQIYPSSPDEKLAEDKYYDQFRDLNIGEILPAALVLYSPSSAFNPGGGSNNWVVNRSKYGKPMLANDPHLGLMVPPVWYFCHLHNPATHVAGASMAGVPGIVIGHNENIAWGLTNVMADIIDLFVLRVDPKNPTEYKIGDETHSMERIRSTFDLPKGKSETRTIYMTHFGPVISEVKEGVDAVVALKWLGGLPVKQIADRSYRGMLGLSKAKNVDEAIYAAGEYKLIIQNLVMADKDGNIAWHPMGAIPKRKGYSGRLPADGSSGKMDWDGFIPYNQLPSTKNPPEGWIATANQNTQTDSPAHKFTHGWCAPYRHERIVQLLNNYPDPSIEDFQKIQMDDYSLQADNLLPRLFNYTIHGKKAEEALDHLKRWNREIEPDSTGTLVFKVFLTKWAEELLGDELGEGLQIYYANFSGPMLLHDTILDDPENAFWDRINTLEKETPEMILKSALVETIDWIEENFGSDRTKWKWGGVHVYFWNHPGAESRLEKKFLSRGPYEAPGDGFTVNAAGFNPAKGGYGVQTIPSMRMIVPLDNFDRTMIVGPMGQSGQPGHPHYDDLLPFYLKGEAVPFPFTREAVEKQAVSRMILKPRK